MVLLCELSNFTLLTDSYFITSPAILLSSPSVFSKSSSVVLTIKSTRSITVSITPGISRNRISSLKKVATTTSFAAFIIHGILPPCLMASKARLRFLNNPRSGFSNVSVWQSVKLNFENFDGSLTGYPRAYCIGSRISGSTICALNDPSVNSISE